MLNNILIALAIVIIIVALLHIINKIILFYYILHIGKQNCNCIHDWRPDFLKYTLLINLFLYTFGVLGILSVFSVTLYKVLLFICIIIECIIAYSYFTYISDLKESNCKCLIGTNKYLYGVRMFDMIITGLLYPLLYILYLKYFLLKR